MHIQRNGVSALQSAAETHLVNMFLYARLCRDHAKRRTLSPNDIRLVTCIRQEEVHWAIPYFPKTHLACDE
jgi:histone H3/H4